MIKLGPNNEDAALLALRTYPNALQIGGGITIDNARKWIDAGASKVYTHIPTHTLTHVYSH